MTGECGRGRGVPGRCGSASRRTATRPAWPGSAERSPGWPGHWPPTCSSVPGDGVPFGLYAVDAAAAGVTRTPLVSLDATRPLADVTLDRAPGRQVATGAAAARAVAAALTAGAGVLASELFGVAEQCLGHDRQLRQGTGRSPARSAPSGRQAPGRRRVGGGDPGRAAARYAAACLATGDPDTPVAVALAKAASGDAAVLAAQECVQLHGGIGFTWEHPAHLLLKRARAGRWPWARRTGTGPRWPPWWTCRCRPGTNAELLAAREGAPMRSVRAGVVVTGRGQRHRGRAGPQVRRRRRQGRGQRPERRRRGRRSPRRAAPPPCPGTRPRRTGWPRCSPPPAACSARSTCTARTPGWPWATARATRATGKPAGRSTSMAHVRAARLLLPGWLERGSGHLICTVSAAGCSPCSARRRTRSPSTPR